jgi:2-(1,2-epoxy-1,2-dihydrophenyl)acetyl-CoA isomerase
MINGYKMKVQNLNKQNKIFSADKLDDVVSITVRGKVLFTFSNLNNKETFFNYLDLVSRNSSVKVVTIRFDQERAPLDEYFEFYDLVKKSKIYKNTLYRMYRACDQLILRIVKSNKFFISVSHGDIISQDFNVALSCDYRIFADDTVIHKPYLQLGLVPKGGGAYFLKNKLGHSRAYEILLSNKVVTAQEALELGLVDKVVPLKELDDTTIKTANHFAQSPTTSLSGTKKLLNYSLKDLNDHLEYENDELLNILWQTKMLKN